ncbi:Hypothetical_protein [Hexamita inflata]|uniref:Hypothetical_protein n=1 Tax=Hexamita inflata TaxID=28002 RepID=A0AA86UL76_9EUKA|nr:Hypothetical protein HINF_LOCUS43292 [Hexamita inflata]
MRVSQVVDSIALVSIIITLLAIVTNKQHELNFSEYIAQQSQKLKLQPKQKILVNGKRIVKKIISIKEGDKVVIKRLVKSAFNQKIIALGALSVFVLLIISIIVHYQEKDQNQQPVRQQNIEDWTNTQRSQTDDISK